MCNVTLRLASNPPSRYTAARIASTASAKSDAFSLPSDSSSPRPSLRYPPNCSHRATCSKDDSLTSCAFSFESVPSVESVRKAARYSLITSESTASPRNSSCSLSRQATLFCSLTYDLWVRASSSRAGSRKQWPNAAWRGSVEDGTGMQVNPQIVQEDRLARRLRGLAWSDDPGIG